MKKKTSKKALEKSLENTLDENDIIEDAVSTRARSIIFNSQMRKTFAKGVFQDIKGYFEANTDGLVEVTYEEHCLLHHEFGFKMVVSRGRGCSKQMFSEVTSAVVNVINYMFSGDCEQYDLAIFTEDHHLEVELTSNW